MRKVNVTNLVYLAILILSCSEVYAMTGTDITTNCRNFITNHIANNVGTVGVMAAAVVGAVAALGQKITQFITNNLGYVAYVAFGGTMSVGALTAAGATI